MQTLFSTLIVTLVMIPCYSSLDGYSALDRKVSGVKSPWSIQFFSVRNYGAIGDGQVKDTEAIQRAVDAACQAGGGTVYFPPGRYLSGTIYMKNFVTLYLESGSVLLGSTELTDFPENHPRFSSYTDNYVCRSLIWAEDLDHIAIVGKGTIDGQGEAYKDQIYLVRPYLIRFITSRNILIEGVTLQNSPMWVQHYLACDFVTIRGIRVMSQVKANNDMLDIDCCHNVHISDSYADTGDDAITLKSTADRTCENITVANCVLRSQCTAIKFGTESNGGFKNITITNCVINSHYDEGGYYGSTKGGGGLALEMVDGGTLENITVSNLTIKGVRVPIFLRLGNRARPFKKWMAKPAIGSFRNVIISNIIAMDVEKFGCSITGLPGNPIQNITLSNIKMTFPGGGTAKDAERQVPEHEAKPPTEYMFGTLPAWGFYCRHVDGLRLSGIDLGLESADQRPALVFDDVRVLDIEGLSEMKKECLDSRTIVLKNVREALIRACRPAPGTRWFLRLEGQTERVSVFDNDLSNIGIPFEFGQGVSESALFQAANRGI